MINHIMLDFETLDTSTFPVLLSVGAVLFDPTTGQVSEPSPDRNSPLAPGTFYRSISAGHCSALGASISTDTLRFWSRQEPEAIRRAFDGVYGVERALFDFRSFVRLYGSDVLLWSNGATFDVTIAAEYFRRLGLDWPIAYYNIRDTRTVWDLGGDTRKTIEKPYGFVKHDPLWDAWLQAVAVCDAYRKLGRATLPPI